MAVPSGNTPAPISAYLIDPANGQPYKYGSADTPVPKLPSGNISAPKSVVAINPTTGNQYKP